MQLGDRSFAGCPLPIGATASDQDPNSDDKFKRKIRKVYGKWKFVACESGHCSDQGK
jgi:hypothetical protein